MYVYNVCVYVMYVCMYVYACTAVLTPCFPIVAINDTKHLDSPVPKYTVFLSFFTI
jgi:hypothetical protein